MEYQIKCEKCGKETSNLHLNNHFYCDGCTTYFEIEMARSFACESLDEYREMNKSLVESGANKVVLPDANKNFWG